MTQDANAVDAARRDEAPKALSIHIGLQYLLEAHYGRTALLASCAKDAAGMRFVATKEGYSHVLSQFSTVASEVLLNQDATLDAVEKRLQAASELLKGGDALLLTFSGHGEALQVAGKRREAWCLFDTPMFDVYLLGLLSRFEPGVTICIVSDSCWSGGIPYLLNVRELRFAFADDITEALGFGHVKHLGAAAAANTVRRHRRTYEELVTAFDNPVVKASVMYVLACGRFEQTPAGATGNDYSAFTAKVLNLWDQGSFAGSFQQFETQLQPRRRQPPIPEVRPIGGSDAAFSARGPFRLAQSQRAESAATLRKNRHEVHRSPGISRSSSEGRETLRVKRAGDLAGPS